MDAMGISTTCRFFFPPQKKLSRPTRIPGLGLELKLGIRILKAPGGSNIEENLRETYGKPMEIYGKPVENLWKFTGNLWKTYGNS